ncbi:hypothetical protein GGR53DRAFT_64336 [Hypoxylon sp. FL1150]|nr:hypothetical protein GGR53DRAFT_64336 [Hypoxylon sp. FL1150]
MHKAPMAPSGTCLFLHKNLHGWSGQANYRLEIRRHRIKTLRFRLPNITTHSMSKKKPHRRKISHGGGYIPWDSNFNLPQSQHHIGSDEEHGYPASSSPTSAILPALESSGGHGSGQNMAGVGSYNADSSIRYPTEPSKKHGESTVNFQLGPEGQQSTASRSQDSTDDVGIRNFKSRKEPLSNDYRFRLLRVCLEHLHPDLEVDGFTSGLASYRTMQSTSHTAQMFFQRWCEVYPEEWTLLEPQITKKLGQGWFVLPSSSTYMIPEKREGLKRKAVESIAQVLYTAHPHPHFTSYWVSAVRYKERKRLRKNRSATLASVNQS